MNVLMPQMQHYLLSLNDLFNNSVCSLVSKIYQLCPFWLWEPRVGLGCVLGLISDYATELFQTFVRDLRYRGIVGVEFWSPAPLSEDVDSHVGGF